MIDQYEDNVSDPGGVTVLIMEEAYRLLGEMQNTDDLARRKELSEVLRNLCESAGVFLNWMTEINAASGFLDEDDSEDIFGDED